MKNFWSDVSLNALALAIVGLILMTGCVKEKEVEEIVDDQVQIQVINDAQLGNILVNQNNQVMYFFAGDVTGALNCTGDCNDVWPPMLGTLSDLELGANLNRDDFGTVATAYGDAQFTYKGWPLYYFSAEGNGELEAPRQTGGDGRGGVFHVAKPDYTVLIGRQSVVDNEAEVVYLVTDWGVTLYLNTADEENLSNCAGGCAGVWPPLPKIDLVIPSSLETYDFDEVYRDDALGPQFSYQGSPLYSFSQDEQQQGRVLGQGGGPNQTFFVVEP
jgi:predicted lipoprotein with Yx(FWY)xxD motif